MYSVADQIYLSSNKIFKTQAYQLTICLSLHFFYQFHRFPSTWLLLTGEYFPTKEQLSEGNTMASSRGWQNKWLEEARAAFLLIFKWNFNECKHTHMQICHIPDTHGECQESKLKLKTETVFRAIRASTKCEISRAPSGQKSVCPSVHQFQPNDPEGTPTWPPVKAAVYIYNFFRISIWDISWLFKKILIFFFSNFVRENVKVLAKICI